MKRHSIALALCVVALAPALACAADLININTADSAALQTLPGIGPSKAQAIIDYRTQHGDFTSIDQIKNVSGIGTVTYGNIQSLITVGSSQPAQTTQTTSPDATTTQPDSSSAQPQVQTQSIGGVSPPTITARITTDASAVVGAGTLFVGAAFGAQGQTLSGVRYVWNFGDGATAEGQQAWHTYSYPGSYDAELSVAYNYSSATARAVVAAVAADVSLVAEGDGSLTVTNQSDYDLDIGSWSLKQGQSLFVIPDGTILLRGKGVRFASQVLKFDGDQTAALYYANGTKAAAATVGAASPLRGQVVNAPTTAVAKPQSASPSLRKPPTGASSPTSTVNGDLAAAAAGAGDMGQWPYWLGLMGIIAIGAVGSYYAYVPPPKAVTTDPADEFDIE